MSKSVPRGAGTLVRQVSSATRADRGTAMVSAALISFSAAVLTARVREVRAEVEPSQVELPEVEHAQVKAVEVVREPSIAPEPIVRAAKRRRTEPVPGRRAKREPVPKPRAEPREEPLPGLLAAIAMIASGIALIVPWVVPNFAGAVDDLFIASGPVVVQDPAVLSAEPTVTTSARPTSTPGVPNSLQVPRLQVSSVVVPISGASGALIPPSNPQQVGWWVQGPKPGAAEGTAVLTGHTVHYGGGAFDHLSFLKVGDHFTVKTDHGTIRYVIVKLHKYETGELAREATTIFRLTGPPRVLLVTCTGWNGRIYLENTVVTGAPST